MEHVEEAGGSLRRPRLAPSRRIRSDAETIGVIEDYTRRIATALDVRGLINVQYAVRADQVFVIEANPRASRTVPFVAKATGRAVGQGGGPGHGRVATLAELRAEGLLRPPVTTGHVAVKEAVLPFKPLPRRRPGARPRDALHRRGHGHRHHVRAGFRQESDRRRRPSSRRREPCSSRWPTATRPWPSRSGRRFVELGFTLAATVGTADALEGERAWPVGPTGGQARHRRGRDRRRHDQKPGASPWWSTAPRVEGPRADGAYIRALKPGWPASHASPPAAAGPRRRHRYGRLGPITNYASDPSRTTRPAPPPDDPPKSARRPADSEE